MQLDIPVAFLNADLEEDIYSDQPMGFEDGTGRRIKILKATYDLKQSPRAFNQKLRRTLLSLGLKTSNFDPCLFFRPPDLFLAGFYVDDACLAATNESDIKEFVIQLKQTFEVKTSSPLERNPPLLLGSTCHHLAG